MRSAGLARRLGAEALEPRQMLATLTIITPDEGGSFPAWAYDMATAVVAREGVFDKQDSDGNGVADFIQRSRYEYGKPLSFPDWGTYSRDVMLLDWSVNSHQAGSAVNHQMIQYFREALQFLLPSRMVGTNDLHFIGHGRGAFVNATLLQSLVDQSTNIRIGHVQVTTLDPYSREDGNLFFNPGGLVDFAENYYQTSGPRAGAPLQLALNFDLSERLAAWSGRAGDDSEHEEVHDWYHWTVAPEVLAADALTLADANLEVPSAADRALLYDAYVADLNGDDEPDDFRGGSRIGYYFTVNAGGIGNLLNVDRGIFTHFYTFDVRTGELPLYLGQLKVEEAAQIAFAPTGLLHVTGDDLQFAESSVVFFDDFGPWRSIVKLGEPWGESAPFARRFSSGGRLAHVSGDMVAEIDPQTTDIKVQLSLVWEQASNRTAAFDFGDDLYLIRVPEAGGASDLIRFDTTYNLPFTVGTIPYDDVISTTVIEGVLYCFRAAGEYFSVNLTTLQVVEQGQLALRAGDSLASVASISSGTNVRWHNRDARNDVTADGRVNSSDALAVINALLVNGPQLLSSDRNFSYYLDVTNDGRLNSSDLLSIFNEILLGSAASTPAAAPLQSIVADTQTPVDTVSVNSSDATGASAKAAHSLHGIAFAASLEFEADKESEPDWWS